MTEETLSDYIVQLEEGLALHPDSVREAVKKLKDKTLRLHCKVCEIRLLEDIDKIFGKKLTGDLNG